MDRELKFGETPWDSWTREELLAEIKRFYSALVGARSVLKMGALAGEGSRYWSVGGAGGDALRKSEAALAPYRAFGESIYRQYFRERDQLIFPDAPELFAPPYMRCHGAGGTCGILVAGEQPWCPVHKHGGPWRLLDWSDFDPPEVPPPPHPLSATANPEAARHAGSEDVGA